MNERLAEVRGQLRHILDTPLSHARKLDLIDRAFAIKDWEAIEVRFVVGELEYSVLSRFSKKLDDSLTVLFHDDVLRAGTVGGVIGDIRRVLPRQGSSLTDRFDRVFGRFVESVEEALDTEDPKERLNESREMLKRAIDPSLTHMTKLYLLQSALRRVVQNDVGGYQSREDFESSVVHRFVRKLDDDELRAVVPAGSLRRGTLQQIIWNIDERWSGIDVFTRLFERLVASVDETLVEEEFAHKDVGEENEEENDEPERLVITPMVAGDC